MTPAQQSALEALAGRALTADQVAQIDTLLPARNDVAIAAILSIGRTKLQHAEVGAGTIVVAMDPVGGAFMDAAGKLGETDRDVFWGMDSVRRGVFDPGLPSAQVWLDRLSAKMPEFASKLAVIKSIGRVSDPFPYDAVSRALNVAEGRMVL